MPRTKANVAAAVASKRMGKTAADESAAKTEPSSREPSPDPAPKRRGRSPKAQTPDPPAADEPHDPADKVRKTSAKAKGKAEGTAGAKDGAAGSSAAKGAEKKGTETGGEVQEPKRPLNSYFMWLAENRERVQGEMGSRTGPGSKRIVSVAGKEWRGMSGEEKAPWQKKARDAKERYDEQLDAFNDAQPSD